MFWDARGGIHALGISAGPNTPSAPVSLVGAGGEGPISATLQQVSSQTHAGAVTVTDGDGTVYQFPGDSGAAGNEELVQVPNTVTDRNGNVISFVDAGNGAITATDDLQRALVRASGFGIVNGNLTNDVWVSGIANPYVITWETITRTFSLANTPADSTSGACPGRSMQQTLNVIQSITLPNGQSYSFDYL